MGEGAPQSAPAQRLRIRPDRVGVPPDPRFTLANQRTFLAWNRTAMALIAGGLAASQLLRLAVTSAGLLVGLTLAVLGGVAGLNGFLRWHHAELALRLEAPLPRSTFGPRALAIGAAAMALLSVVLLVYSEVS